MSAIFVWTAGDVFGLSCLVLFLIVMLGMFIYAMADELIVRPIKHWYAKRKIR